LSTNNSRWQLFSNVLNVPQTELDDLKNWSKFSKLCIWEIVKNKISEQSIGDQTKCRRMASLNESTIPFINRLVNQFREYIKRYNLYIHDVTLLQVDDQCEVQQYHEDFVLSKNKKNKVEWPYSCIVALDNDTYILIEGKRVEIPKRSAIIFRADVTHSGMGGESGENMRLFFYLDTDESLKRLSKIKYRETNFILEDKWKRQNP
jgi:hypothetical protein